MRSKNEAAVQSGRHAALSLPEIDPCHEEKTITVRAPVISIGSGVQAHVRLVDETIDSDHARLYIDHSMVVLENRSFLGSTQVDGIDLIGCTVIANGEEFTVGPYVLQIIDHDKKESVRRST